MGWHKYAWASATIIGLFVGAAVLAALFVFWQIRKGADAMIPPKLFIQRTVFFAYLTESFAMGTVFIALFYLPQWFQIVKGVTPTRSGLMYLPLAISDVLSAILTGVSLSYVGLPNPFILSGTALLSIGAGLLSTLSAFSGSQYWIPYQILSGAGAGITLSMSYIAIQTLLKPEDIPIATSLLQFSQFFGAAVFLASGQAVFSNRFYESLATAGIDRSSLPSMVYSLPVQFRETVPKDQLVQVLDAYNQGVTGTFYLDAGLAAAACLISLGMQWKSVKPKAD